LFCLTQWTALPRINRLEAFRTQWNSDNNSAADLPLLADPQQWRLLPTSFGYRSGPGGKDVGADLDRLW
jgi:hypothetical protein